MSAVAVDPWRWQEPLGYSQAVVVRGAERWLFCAGQGAAAEDGSVLHPGDVRRQLGVAVSNLETVLAAAGFALADVVRMTVYTTDVAALFSAFDALLDRLRPDCVPAGTVVEVAALAQPGMVVELEATAAR